jgi:hypothetical protein
MADAGCACFCTIVDGEQQVHDISLGFGSEPKRCATSFLTSWIDAAALLRCQPVIVEQDINHLPRRLKRVSENRR